MDEAIAQQYRAALARYLQADVVEEVFAFMDSHGVNLHITRDRKSKLGDYRWPQHGRTRHTISINGTLNPYMFLMVLLHEQAHLLTYERHGTTVAPHGHEWQDNYRQLLRHYAGAGHFPPDSLAALQRYTKQIPLYGPAGKAFEAILQRYDPGYEAGQHITLDDLPVGSTFRLRHKPAMLFRSCEKRRTRYRCIELGSNAAYLVAGNAPVLPVEEEK